MAAEIHIDQDTGSASISLVGIWPSSGAALKFAVYDAVTRRYLTPDGWASNRKTIAEVLPQSNSVEIVLEAATVKLISGGTTLVVEEIFINFRAQVVWPKPVAQVAPDLVPEPEPTLAVSAGTFNEPLLETLAQEPGSPSPASQHRDRPSSWLVAGAGVLLGMLVCCALLYFSPSLAGLLVPSSEASQQHLIVGANGLDNSERVTLVAERDQLRQDLAKTRAALDDARASVPAPLPTSGANALEISRLTRERDELSRNNADLKLGLATRDRRIEELSESVEHVESDGPKITDEAVELGQLRVRVETQANSIIELRARLNEQTLLAEQAVAPPPTPWLGAAVDTAGSVFVVTNQDDKRSARAAAMAKCQLKGRGCDFIGIYKNTCFAVARPAGQRILPANYWYGTEADRDDAQTRAVYECQRGSTATCSAAFVMCATDH